MKINDAGPTAVRPLTEDERAARNAAYWQARAVEAHRRNTRARQLRRRIVRRSRKANR